MKLFLRFCCFCLISSQHSFSQVPVSEMLEKALGSVVTVAVYESNSAMKPMGFRGRNSEMAYAKALDLTGAKGSGSGFVIIHNGKYYIITNAHVIQQASDKEGSIIVYSINNTKYVAKLLGGDTFYDIAVLELRNAAGPEITPMAFRTTDILLGEPVYAIGNPLGDYPYTVTSGIVSAKNRVRDGLTGKFGFLQTSATIIWGNSGGPLIDQNGNVVGINSQITFADNQGDALWQPQINFALEGQLANKLINEIIDNKGLIKRAYIGVEVSKKILDPARSDRGSPNNKESFDSLPIISGVISNSPAEKILAKYIGHSIQSVNGERVKNIQDVLGAFEKISPEEEVNFEIKFAGKTSMVNIKTETSNASTTAEIAKYAIDLWGGKDNIDVLGVNLDFNDRAKYIKFQKTTTEFINVVGSDDHLTSNILFDNQWIVLAAGVVSKTGSQIWKIKDLTDLGTALRLSATSGVTDLVLFKKGSDPANDNNYFQKRFILSGRNYLIKQTLWY